MTRCHNDRSRLGNSVNGNCAGLISSTGITILSSAFCNSVSFPLLVLNDCTVTPSEESCEYFDGPETADADVFPLNGVRIATTTRRMMAARMFVHIVVESEEQSWRHDENSTI